MNTLHVKKSLIALLAVATLAGCDSDSDSDSSSAAFSNFADEDAIEALFISARANYLLDNDGVTAILATKTNAEKIDKVTYTGVYSVTDSGSTEDITVTIEAEATNAFLTEFNSQINSGGQLKASPCVLLNILKDDSKTNEISAVTVIHGGTTIVAGAQPLVQAVAREAQALYTLIGCRNSSSTTQSAMTYRHSLSFLKQSKIELRFAAESAGDNDGGVTNNILASNMNRKIILDETPSSVTVTSSGFGTSVTYANGTETIALNGEHKFNSESAVIAVLETSANADTVFELAMKVPFFDQSNDADADNFPTLFNDLGETGAEKIDLIKGYIVNSTSTHDAFSVMSYKIEGSFIDNASISPTDGLCQLAFVRYPNPLPAADATNLYKWNKFDGAGSAQLNDFSADTGTLATASGCNTNKDDYDALTKPANLLGFETNIEFAAADDPTKDPGTANAANPAHPTYFPDNGKKMEIRVRRSLNNQLMQFGNFSDGATSQSTVDSGNAKYDAAGNNTAPYELRKRVFRSPSY
tara:strand:- start:78 stop:1658 length:1581 start_codon:yes stop_codon:yes gene_type:complete